MSGYEQETFNKPQTSNIKPTKKIIIQKKSISLQIECFLPQFDTTDWKATIYGIYYNY